MWECLVVFGININFFGMWYMWNKLKDFFFDDIDRVWNFLGMWSCFDWLVKKFLGCFFEEVLDEFFGLLGVEVNYGIIDEVGEKVWGFFNEIEGLVEDVDFDCNVLLEEFVKIIGKDEVDFLVD